MNYLNLIVHTRCQLLSSPASHMVQVEIFRKSNTCISITITHLREGSPTKNTKVWSPLPPKLKCGLLIVIFLVIFIL